MLRINNLDKWTCLESGKVLDLPSHSSEARKIRIEFNTDQPTRLDVVVGGKPTFLGVVLGLEVVEFTAGGNVQIAPQGDGDVWFFTNDGDVPSYTIADPDIFTKVAQRKTRNRELERMMWKMEENMRRRLEKQADEIAVSEQRRAARRAADAAAAEADPETGEVKVKGKADGKGKVGSGAIDGSKGADGKQPASDGSAKADGAVSDAAT